MAQAAYRVEVGLSYPPDRRAEAGEVVSDLPAKSIKWLLEQGAITRADGKATDTPAEALEGPSEALEADTPADMPEEG